MYIHLYICLYMYIHVHELIYLYVHCTYTFMNINICMDMVQTCLYRFTTTLHIPSHSLHVIVCTCLNIVCTLYIHVWTWYGHVLLKVPPSNSAVPGSDNAMVQEFAFWYIQCSDTSIHPNNSSGRW